MEISESETADIVTLSLSGRLDSTTAKTFEDAILGRIESGRHRFVVELSQLKYISSAGLRVFALAGKRLKTVNGKLDRKSTRLNSSHMSISYAVFCLKKKK